MTETITIRGQEFILHPTGAVFWKEKSTLLIADVHFGKITHFRKHGIALPLNAAQKNIERLGSITHLFQPASIYFLGDLFHSTKNSEWYLFEGWRHQCDCEVFLIAGNHDIIQHREYARLDVHVCENLIDDGFLLTHLPTQEKGLFTICGHLHPGIRLHGAAKQSLTLPCFHKTRQQLVLPAFGAFTGKFFIQLKAGDEVYAIAEESIFSLSPTESAWLV